MIFARRFHWQNNPLENTALLDAFVAHPEFLTYPTTPEDARIVWAAMLVDPANMVWVTYSDHALTGVMWLSYIVPKVTALLHFTFLDRDLVSKRKLLKNLLSYCFTDLGLHRVSMEVPEGVRLERFARKVLDFRLEGEIRNRNPELPKCLSNDWVARQGSRREQSYFDGEKWTDILLLRLLASEWVGDTGEGNATCLGQLSRQHSQDPSSVP